MHANGSLEYRNSFLIYFTIGKWDIQSENVNLDLYNKSRMMGDYHVRFCERLRVKFPLPTRYEMKIRFLKISVVSLVLIICGFGFMVKDQIRILWIQKQAISNFNSNYEYFNSLLEIDLIKNRVLLIDYSKSKIMKMNYYYILLDRLCYLKNITIKKEKDIVDKINEMVIFLDNIKLFMNNKYSVK